MVSYVIAKGTREILIFEDWLNIYEGFSILFLRFTFIEKLPFKDKGLLQKLQGENN